MATLLDSIVRLPPSVCEFNSGRHSLITTLQQMGIVPTKQFVASADKVEKKLGKGSLFHLHLHISHAGSSSVLLDSKLLKSLNKKRVNCTNQGLETNVRATL